MIQLPNTGFQVVFAGSQMNKMNCDHLLFNDANDIATLSDRFQNHITGYGFDAFELVETTDLHPHTPFHFGTAETWRRIYIANGFRFIDPYLATSRYAGLPFDLGAVAQADFKTKALVQLAKAAEAAGITQCLCIPHHQRDRQEQVHSHFLALIWTRTESEFRNLMAEHRHAVHIVALYFLDRVMVLRGLSEESDPNAPTLTDREREILTQAAQGKTSDDIAVLLNISGLTAETHLKNAIKKMRARNRTHAVALAIARGLIRI